MADAEKPKSEPHPESPTTAKALDFDDDTADAPSSPPNKSTPSKPTPHPGSGEDVAPPKPPRPLAPEQQAENTLKEAFPAIDASVIKAVLRASGGRVEPAFNALLGMSDPDAAEPAAPPQPPRRQQPPTTAEEDQLAADERYARQLAEHYNGADSYGTAPQQQRRGQPQRQERPPPNQYDDEDREHSFFDDDLPVIRDNIKKGFLETQNNFNKWVTTLKKKIDGEDEDDFQKAPAVPAQNYTQPNTYGSRRSSEFGRRSTDRERYDADPQVIGDDFAGLHLHDNEAHPERRSSRPQANPDLFKPTPRPPSNAGRRVSFQDGPPEEIDIHYPKSPSPLNRPGSGAGGKNSKWQPLAAADPSPVAEHDPFSLGDSDDEESKKNDVKSEDTERLKQAAAEAMAGDIGPGDGKKLEPHDRSGSLGQRDKTTEDLVKKS
ncbi:uncharacterized protein KY384_007015 [Bacidia gigantensis]|uniref:uncharacterized protein n=1 Tax=Bacidia gigantensis TaxID=2732470 RepID=UPI001D059793|nr:uncharacterized protein KY384_007015 [Bacidia gigantensis]KAG8528099.1 hypothetical protein KY384_007015 [Bacidia gigantensis]